MKRVYLSGPISLGDQMHNFHMAATAQRDLMEAGYAVLNPMLTMKHPAAKEIPWDLWIAGDLPWVEVADLLIRLPGESVGADLEVRHAVKHNIPVYRACISLPRSNFTRELGAYTLGVRWEDEPFEEACYEVPCERQRQENDVQIGDVPGRDRQ